MRRAVRVDATFFEVLDRQLGPERGPNGEPSAGDFLLVDLPPIAEAFATSFDDLITPIPGRPDYRSHLSTGLLVSKCLVTGHLDSTGIVTLIHVSFDFGE